MSALSFTFALIAFMRQLLKSITVMRNQQTSVRELKPQRDSATRPPLPTFTRGTSIQKFAWRRMAGIFAIPSHTHPLEEKFPAGKKSDLFNLFQSLRPATADLSP
jgi:hypothetical protein